MALPGQLTGEIAGRLGGPPQRRHRIAALLRLDQGQQHRAQPRIQVSGPLAPAAGPPCPAQRLSPGVQLINAQGHRGLADPGRPGHQTDPAMPQRPRLGAHQQPPLPLIQMREDRPELRRQHLLGDHHGAHTTPACQNPGSYGLFSGKP
jgi:hypothetical protein